MSTAQAKALAKQAAADAKVHRVHEAAMQLLIDLKLPTAALSHPALVRLYEAICSALDQPVTKMANWLMSPQQVENHALYKQHFDNTVSEQAETTIEVVQHASVTEEISIEEVSTTEGEIPGESTTPQAAIKRPPPDESPSPEKRPAKRLCNTDTTMELDDLPDDMNERDYVEQFLRTSVEDFLPTRKTGKIIPLFLLKT